MTDASMNSSPSGPAVELTSEQQPVDTGSDRAPAGAPVPGCANRRWLSQPRHQATPGHRPRRPPNSGYSFVLRSRMARLTLSASRWLDVRLPDDVERKQEHRDRVAGERDLVK